jgi:hypothetical protein
MTDFGATRISRCLRLRLVLREGYNTGILLFSYQSIDIHFILLHVKFKNGSSFSVSKNKAARYKTLQLEIEYFVQRPK